MSTSVQQVPIQVQVAEPSGNAPDNNITNLLGGKSGEMITAELHGKYFTQVFRGNVFIGSTAYGGVVVPIYSTTAPTFGLWNPAGNSKLAVLISIAFGMSSVGTKALTSLGLCYQTGVGSAVGTAAPVVAWNTAAPVNARLGSGRASSMLFSPAGTDTLTAAATFLMTLGLGTEAATAGNGVMIMRHNFDGSLIVPPGTLIHVAGAPLAPGSTYDITLVWEEVPV